MADEETLSARHRGRTPPGLDDEWGIASIAIRVLNSDETAVCAATGEPVSLGEHHIYVTARRPLSGYNNEYKHFVIRDEDALEEWLADE